jgi:hypothetical protein
MEDQRIKVREHVEEVDIAKCSCCVNLSTNTTNNSSKYFETLETIARKTLNAQNQAD